MKTMLNAGAAFALALMLGADAHATYIVTDLGGGIAYGLNSSGQAVGENAAGHAFLYSGGTSTDLGTLGGSYSLAFNINDAGQVVGYSHTSGSFTSAFLYSNGMMSNLTPGSLYGGAQGINSAGQVVGWYADSSSGTHPFLYSNGVTSPLGTFAAGSDTFPLSINASGTAVGYTYLPGVTGEQPFLVQNGTTTILNTSGAFQSVNAGGQIVGGHYLSDTSWNAISYINGTTTDLGTLGGSQSWAYGVNGAGQIVGDSTTASGADHAYIYSNGAMTDLNSLIAPNSGWTVEQAFAINGSGQIVGWGLNANGQADAYLLTPTTAPEPSTLTLLATGALGLIGYGWRRRKAVH